MRKFFYDRYCVTDRRFAIWISDEDAKAYRIHIGRYGIKVSLKHKVHCFYFSPIPF